MHPVRRLSILLAAPLAAAAACGGSSGQPEPTTCSTSSGMGVLQDFDVPCDPGPNGFLLTASGEVLALGGYRFPPPADQPVAFVDGWDLTYDRVLTTFDHVTLSRNPDRSPTDQSQCDDASGNAIKCGDGSSVVAEVDGPFAIDLHKGGPFPGAGGGAEQAVAVAALTGQNQLGNAAFDPTMKYAFGFEVVPATTMAKNIDLDAADLADYQEMVAKGYTTMLVGTAVWKGNNNGSLTNDGCTSTIAGYDFSTISSQPIHFKLGISAPTVYRNAQNPQLTGAPFPNEEHPRGVQTVANASTTAQLTFHLDHFFWESFVHDSPAHFDQFAAKYAGSSSAIAMSMDDFKGYALTPFVDAQGTPLPWRECQGDTPPGTGAMTFDTQGIQVDPTGECDATTCDVIRDFYDYTRYNHSTFGHLNSDGLSFVDRQYPSPK